MTRMNTQTRLQYEFDKKEDSLRQKQVITQTRLDSQKKQKSFYLAGAASIALGLFSLTLPHTPPKKTGKDVRLGEILGLDALALLKKPSFAIFIACMFLICVPLYFYFVNMNLYVTELGWSYTAAKMSLAQVSDVVFLILLPLMLRTLGYKKTIFLGILVIGFVYELKK